MLAFMFVNAMIVLKNFVGCGLKAEHGNIMDVLFFFVLSEMSLYLLPKQLIAKIVQVLYVMEK